MKIAIIGAGAAGLMAAATISEIEQTATVILFEKNDGLGKKVIISGGGRCNVTTGIQDVRTVLKKYPRGGKFLSSAMYTFPPEAVYEWFEARGVPLKIEEDFRVFPQSNNGRDIVGVFERIFARSQELDVRLKTSVTKVERRGESFAIWIKGEDQPQLVDKVVLTTGGQAYRQTGSTGDGYAFAQSLGHTITDLAPSLNAFFTRETWPARVSGVSFSSAKVRSVEHKVESTGPFLFTHQGISGPAVFALSSHVAFKVYDEVRPLKIEIDLFPERASNDLCRDLAALIEKNGKKSLLNIVALIVPKSLAEVVCEEEHLPIMRRAAEVSKGEIMRIVTWLKGVPLQVIGRGAGDEFVTAGGISLTEVDPTTMESKICPGLYFAGEMLDIDGYTGGFNLQASWATGRLVGESIGQSLPRSSI